MSTYCMDIASHLTAFLERDNCRVPITSITKTYPVHSAQWVSLYNMYSYWLGLPFFILKEIWFIAVVHWIRKCILKC